MRPRSLNIALVLGIALLPLLFLRTAAPVVAQEASATPESAATVPSFAIYPKGGQPHDFFQVTQDAGTTAKYTVTLVNTGQPGSDPFVGRTFASNVSIRTNGGLDSGTPTDNKVGLTAWISFPTDIVTLEPREGIERTFDVTVPKDTKPGQYISALSFETADPFPIPGTPNLKQNLRQTIAFVLTVPGKIEPAFKIENLHLIIDSSLNGMLATIVNTGNIVVRPAGKVTVSDLSGKPLFTQNLQFGSFFAFMSGQIQIGFSQPLPAGEFLVTVELRDPDNNASAIIENQRVKSMTQGEVAAAEAPPVNFSSVTAVFKPSLTNPQFLNVAGTITNDGNVVDRAELSIAAYRDGKLVENYVLVSPLALPKGDTNFSSRYIPADGFTKGTWTFSLTVQVRDPKTGVATVLNTAPLGNPVAIP